MGKNSLRVSTGAKRIEVNDNGEYITLHSGNAGLAPGFRHLSNSITMKSKEVEQKAKAVADSDISDDEKAERILELNAEICKALIYEVDNLIGAGTCQKVFGDITPDCDSFAQFFGALSPYINEIAAEQAGRMNKYSAARMGNG